MSHDSITLPNYKTPAPRGQSGWAWFLFFLKPHEWSYITCLLINLIRQSFFRSQPLFLGILVGWVESGALKNDPMLAMWWLALYAGLALGAFFTLFYMIPKATRAMDGFSKHISLYGFRHYLSLSEDWHENRASGEKLQRLLKARDSSFAMLEDTLWHYIQIPAILIAVIVSVTVLDAPWYFIVLFFALILSYIVSSYITGNWLSERFKKFYKTQEDVVGSAYEFLISTSTVRLFNLRKHIMKKAENFESINHVARIELFKTVAMRWFIIDTQALICALIIICTAIYQVLYADLSVSAFATIIFLTVSIWVEIEIFAILYARIIDYWEGFKRLSDVLNQTPAIQDDERAINLKTTQAGIEFDKIAFKYQVEKTVITDFDLSIKAGEKIGLLGPSGAGKSTLVKLLMRFYDVESGAIKIAGHDVRTLTQASIQHNIAVIPQDVVLFNHPLIENIRYGRLDAGDDEVMEAARQANAHEFIQELPGGYQTLVGERGVKLSGGQRQRIAIARAILKDAPILVLDEATSALDSESEKLIQESLLELMHGKTVIAIAHRLSTISHLDRLIVMENGRIIETGDHAALIAKNGLYAKLWSMQSGGFIKGEAL